MTTDATKTSPADRFYVPPTVTPLPPVSWHFTGPVPIMDLTPLIAHFEKELQRLRDQLFVEQSAARSAREALVACEHRLEHARCDAKDAQQMLMDERKRSAVPVMTPGSKAAVIEAYRLLAGYEPVFGANGQWADGGELPIEADYDAERALLVWLNKNARDGSRT